ncbi:MAG TPA: type I phosphomannose isomerase catalytic subunit, partial [Ktedonobacterales bacterium]|nr:type I phosphomannose isomerase catalytic subunit [Ktedonobacterales bacterium]
MAAAHDEQRSLGEGLDGRLGPIKLRASLHETIWGGQRLSTVAGKTLPPDKRIGEAWETALDSRVVTTPHADLTLDELVTRYGAALLGSRTLAVYGPRFPLLAKFIDAHDWLSVQAHPDDAYAAAHEDGKLGKTETWYILSAEPGAQIVYGLAHASSPEEVRAAIASNTLEPLLRTLEAHAGDVIFVPAGTIHAIGAGVTLYELQEYSDVTYRLYDYGRLQANGQPRELHVERALDVIRYAPAYAAPITPVTLPVQPGLTARRALVACRYFVEEELTVAGTMREPACPSSCRILTVLQGELEIVTEAEQGGPQGETVRLGTGETAVLPACLGDVQFSGSATLVRSYVPKPDDPTLAL